MHLTIIILVGILLATIEFNKQLIDNVKPDAKQQKEWHYAQLVLWIITYGSIAYLSGEYMLIAIFACFYPSVYDIGLSLRRGLKWNHKGKHDLPDIVKISLIVIGIILIIIKS
jgi:hypothetical protein